MLKEGTAIHQRIDIRLFEQGFDFWRARPVETVELEQAIISHVLGNQRSLLFHPGLSQIVSAHNAEVIQGFGIASRKLDHDDEDRLEFFQPAVYPLDPTASPAASLAMPKTGELETQLRSTSSTEAQLTVSHQCPFEATLGTKPAPLFTWHFSHPTPFSLIPASGFPNRSEEDYLTKMWMRMTRGLNIKFQLNRPTLSDLEYAAQSPRGLGMGGVTAITLRYENDVHQLEVRFSYARDAARIVQGLYVLPQEVDGLPVGTIADMDSDVRFMTDPTPPLAAVERGLAELTALEMDPSGYFTRPCCQLMVKAPKGYGNELTRLLNRALRSDQDLTITDVQLP